MEKVAVLLPLLSASTAQVARGNRIKWHPEAPLGNGGSAPLLQMAEELPCAPVGVHASPLLLHRPRLVSALTVRSHPSRLPKEQAESGEKGQGGGNGGVTLRDLT